MPNEGRRYQVQKVLGRGGFGTVYEAEMLSTGGFSKSVALKVLNPEVDAIEDVARRLRDEARLLGRLKHPNIVRVDDLVRLDGRWTVVMELLTGANLHQVQRASGPLPLGVAMEIVQAVAGALHAAHDRAGPEGHPMGVLHRDIKPSNVQLTPLGEVKVLDFGVARASFGGREAQTRSLIFGSVGYMAPERLAGRDTHAGDVYALGVVTYEILAGRRFGTACSQARLQGTMVADAIEELAARHPDPDLRQLLCSALAFEPEDRPRARAFQRLARAVRSRNPDPWLSDWAEEILADVMPALQTSSGNLTGHVLCEAEGPSQPDVEAGSLSIEVTPQAEAPPEPTQAQPETASPGSAGPTRFERIVTGSSESRPDPAPLADVQLTQASVPLPREAPAPAPAPRRWPLALGIGLASSAGVVGLGWGLLAGPWMAPEAPVPGADATPPPAVAPLPTEARAPEGTAPPVDAPAPAGPALAAPRRAAAPRSSDAPPTTPSPAAPLPPEGVPTLSPPVLPASVRVSGDALEVRLVGEAGTLAPGSVPPGRYALQALFAGLPAPVAAGEITLEPGQRVRIDCRSGFDRCVPVPD